MEPVKVMVCRFPYGGKEHATVCTWLVGAVCDMKLDQRIKHIMNYTIDDTPVTMSRNRALHVAQQNQVDFMLMIDSDMNPDFYHESNPHRRCVLERARPFWRTSFDFLWKQRQQGSPSVIAAPYCGPPPLENIYVFRWQTKATDVPPDDSNMTLEQFDRWTAYHMRGITPVAALPTGLFLIDMKALEAIDPPYTYYEHDPAVTVKDSTEDVTFTRDLSMRGVKLYCNWDAWAGHWKEKCVGMPHIVSGDQVGKQFETSVLKKYGILPGEKLTHWNPHEVTNGQRHSEASEEDQRSCQIQQHGELECFNR